jgi:lycopene beta-cyclase
MTHLQAEETGFFFTYVLPYSASRALVEVTAVSCPKQGRQASREELRAHLDDRLGKDRYRIERFEAGRLPMGLPTLPAKAAANLWRAGTQGGALRMSSGYAFLRIQRWAEREAGRLKAGLPPQGHPRPSFVEKYLDPLFLQVLRHQPELAPEIFMKLGNQMSADRFVRFMIDEPQVADLAQLIAVLPKVPFMKQLARGFLRHPAGHASSSVSSRHG